MNCFRKPCASIALGLAQHLTDRYTPRMHRGCTILLAFWVWLLPASALGVTVIDDRAWLGVSILDGSSGVLVREVVDNSPAALAGLAVGDEVHEVAGMRVRQARELISVIKMHDIGDRVRLTVQRKDKTLYMLAILAPMPSEDELLHYRLVGKPARQFRLPVVSGEDSGRLGDLRGRVLIMAFTSANCDMCRPIHRQMSRMVDQRPGADLAVLAIARGSRTSLEDWVRYLSPSFTVLHDPLGHTFEEYRVPGDNVPVLVVVDRDGTILYAAIARGEGVEGAFSAARRALDVIAAL